MKLIKLLFYSDKNLPCLIKIHCKTCKNMQKIISLTQNEALTPWSLKGIRHLFVKASGMLVKGYNCEGQRFLFSILSLTIKWLILQNCNINCSWNNACKIRFLPRVSLLMQLSRIQLTSHWDLVRERKK